MNWLLSRKRTLQDTVTALKEDKELYDWETASISGMSLVPSQPREFLASDEFLAAILDCRSIHGIRWVLQETFLKASLLEVNHRQHSRNQRIWHHLLQVIQDLFWNMEEV